jgi:hypothetical protein
MKLLRTRARRGYQLTPTRQEQLAQGERRELMRELFE